MQRTSVNQHKRAFHTWQILANCAANQSTITYGALAKQLGIHHRPVRYVLSLIQDYCLSEKLPPLTILVINEKGRPGTGFIAWDIDNIEEGLKQVHLHPWRNLVNPFSFAESGATFDEIAQQLTDSPEKAEELYAKVKIRGIAQQIFREILLMAYKNSCAFSGIALPDVLDAVHIVPWSKCNGSERLDPRNGILLSGLHHKLFDCGYIVLLEDYSIAVSPAILEKAGIGNVGFDSIAQLNGKRMFLPNNRLLWPAQKHLSFHRAAHSGRHLLQTIE